MFNKISDSNQNTGISNNSHVDTMNKGEDKESININDKLDLLIEKLDKFTVQQNALFNILNRLVKSMNESATAMNESASAMDASANSMKESASTLGELVRNQQRLINSYFELLGGNRGRLNRNQTN